jgi:hypothetical protein
MDIHFFCFSSFFSAYSPDGGIAVRAFGFYGQKSAARNYRRGGGDLSIGPGGTFE